MAGPPAGGGRGAEGAAGTRSRSARLQALPQARAGLEASFGESGARGRRPLQPVSGARVRDRLAPDAPYILDGLLDPQTSVRPREIVTDTAGYTDVIFGLFRLLGYQYSPRLADAGAATFWRLNSTDHGPLNNLARHQVNRVLVEQHYDDLLRVAGSLLQRHTTASQLVRALRSHTRHLASLARALQHVGRAAKTIHLLDYCNDQPFRRRILTQLNRGESRHALARDVCHSHRGELRQRYRQGQEEQLGALGLIVNAIVLYNTIYTQRALDHLTNSGLAIDDADIERLGPLATALALVIARDPRTRHGHPHRV